MNDETNDAGNGADKPLPVVPPGKKLDPNEIAGELYRLLYGTDEPCDAVVAQGRVRTFTRNEFRTITGYAALPKHLFADVERAAIEWGIVIGFGWYAVIVSTDDNFAPNGWGSSS